MSLEKCIEQRVVFPSRIGETLVLTPRREWTGGLRTDHSTGYRLGGPKRVHGEILIRGEQRQGMPGKPDGSRGEGTPKRKWIDFVEYLVSSTLERAFGLLWLLIDIVHESVIASGEMPPANECTPAESCNRLPTLLARLYM